MRVTNHPPHGPKPVHFISTAQQHLAAGLQVISHCSAHPAWHKHVINLEVVPEHFVNCDMKGCQLISFTRNRVSLLERQGLDDR